MQKFDNRQDIADIESIKIDFLTFSEDGNTKESQSLLKLWTVIFTSHAAVDILE